MGRVTVTAKEQLAEAVKRSGRRSTVQLPEEFARIQDPGDTSTPLSSLFLQGEVALKIYLTLVMLTAAEPHKLRRVVPDHYWAELLGYEELNPADPIAGAGTRRVRRAMKALGAGGPEGKGWVTRTLDRGRGYAITVVHPDGPKRAPYITIPLEFWSRGWINVISARGLFVYLCLRLVLAGKKDHEGAHVSTTDRARFLIKDDTWQRGVRELEELGLARSETTRAAPDRWSTDLRIRKVYYLNTEFLKENDSRLEPVVL
ncbi:hypothetical protein [Nocardia jinanensis]|uniref:Uncharacterized protein n=1 Tax=Nocardia jinanensis TaxID=382504 RepID=A0A917VZU5_9NOCA|nr:hypothetical protein [Nocardia jinanensis]GGL44099.1 hypothetical protein GCM10011588_68510 [Nocardia jinanensis]